MHHIAILSNDKPWLEMILSGEKTIESRWYKTRRAPWHKIKKGDTVWFKKSGKPVSAKAKVSDALFFHLQKTPPSEVLRKYGKKICLDKAPKGKNYCILAFLENAQKITPFKIDKTGYGNANAWICAKPKKL